MFKIFMIAVFLLSFGVSCASYNPVSIVESEQAIEDTLNKKPRTGPPCDPAKPPKGQKRCP